MEIQFIRSITWTGDNLKEVLEFVSYRHPKFDEWFASFEDYEKYVHSHGDIFKLFTQNGHYEISVGCVIKRNEMTKTTYPVTENKFKFIVA